MRDIIFRFHRNEAKTDMGVIGEFFACRYAFSGACLEGKSKFGDLEVDSFC